MEKELKLKIKELSKPSPAKLYVALGFEMLALALILVLAAQTSIYLAPVYILLLGVFQHRFALLGHDCCHVNFTKSPLCNYLTAETIGFPLCVAVNDGYRKYHFQHHRTLGTDDDPELSYRDGWDFGLSRAKVVRTFFLDLFGYGVRPQTKFMGEVFPESWKTIAGMFSFWAVVVGLCAYFQMFYLLALWFISLFTSFWAVFRVRAFLEHVDVPLEGSHSSHRFFTTAFVRFVIFPHNTWCHYEHHLFPTVPFHNLPDLRQLLSSSEYKEVKSLAEILH